MLGFWQALPAETRTTLIAEMHGRTLRVELDGPHRWHWTVRSETGNEMSAGDAASATDAQEAAEHEVYCIHPPIPGDWVGTSSSRGRAAAPPDRPSSAEIRPRLPASPA